MTPEDTKFCVGCGAQISAQAKFCVKCGEPVIPASASAPVGAEPVPPPPMEYPPTLPAATVLQPAASPSAMPTTALPPAATRPYSQPGQAPGGTAASPGSTSGQFIGPYRLVKELGRGGMGVVYLAMRDDGAFKKNVALKVLLGEQVNEEFVRRFKQERQVLAALDHPNIARILDGGDTPQGMPYYVMEYVEGAPLDEYCDQQRLGITARIQAFQQVCRAVEYLHQNSILHRDLKPSNILVTADGMVKLLDFGIAKLVGAAAFANPELTSAQGSPMTPAYASPEQISGVTLQKTSDVYSLGAILYRLLTGRPPYEGVDEKLAKLFTRQAPANPSTNIREDLKANDTTARLRRTMMGELDSIVLMSLRFDPKERYQTAAALADDLQRFIDGQPVMAHHGSVAGRSFKLLKRKRVMVAVLAGFVVLGAFGAWQWRQGQLEASEAAAREAHLRDLLSQLEGRMDEPLPQRIQDVQLLKTAFDTDFTALAAGKASPSADHDALLNRGVHYLDQVHAAQSDPSLDVEVADAFMHVGSLQENTADPKTGGRKAALPTYQKASVVLANAHVDDAKTRDRMAALNQKMVQLGGVPAPSIAPETPAENVPPPEPTKPAPSPKLRAQTKAAEPPPPTQVATPPPAPAAVVAAPVAPATPRLSAAVRADLEDRMLEVTSKVQTAEQAIEPIRRNLTSRGQTLNPDTQSAMIQMRSRLARATNEANAGEADAAKEDLAAAEGLAAKVMRTAGR